MWERLRNMMIKEFLQVLRNPKMRGIIFVMPLVQVMVFGYAVTTDVRDIPVAVVDFDRSVASRELLSRFSASGYFRFVAHTRDVPTASHLLDKGSVRAILRIDPGFEADLQAGRTAKLQVIADGTDSNTAGIVLDYTGRIAGAFSGEVLLDRTSRLGGGGPLPGRVELVSRAWFNENLESRNFYVPGVIAIIVMLITLMLTSMAVVREKEIGTIEQLLVSPITPAEFILGKTLPFVLIGYIDVALISTVGALVFDVPVRGSLWLLFLATTLFLMSSLGLGLLISTVSQTQQQAMMSAFFIIFPAMLLSGFAFPIENMPEPVQWLTLLNPLRYYMVIIRGIFMKGVGIDILWPQLATLGGLGAVLLSLAVTRFHKTLV